jgi:hypothetical protein
MENYQIEHKGGYDYITSVDHNFTLRVIPPQKQEDEEDKDYTPYTTVSAVFELPDDLEPPAWISDPELDIPEDWAGFDGGESEVYDFEGVNIDFRDDDLPTCNKELWLGAINYYCQLKLDKAVVALLPYNYQYEFSELNCAPETLALLTQTEVEVVVCQEPQQDL